MKEFKCSVPLHVEKYLSFLEGVNKDNVEDLRPFAHEDMVFKDPISDAKGIEAVVSCWQRTFSWVQSGRFEFQSYDLAAVPDSGEIIVYLNWSYRVHPAMPIINRQAWTLRGLSKICFNEDGQVYLQEGFWDGVTQILFQVPIAKTLLRKLQTQIGLRAVAK